MKLLSKQEYSDEKQRLLDRERVAKICKSFYMGLLDGYNHTYKNLFVDELKTQEEIYAYSNGWNSFNSDFFRRFR